MLKSTVTGCVPAVTAIVKLLPATPVATSASGTGTGSRTVHGALQPVGFAGSAHLAADTPTTLIGCALPPKFTVPLVAAMKSVIAVLPSVSSVGKAKFQYLNPVIALSLESTVLVLPAEI